MAKISNKVKYPIDTVLTGSERLIGTDADGSTKSYSVDSIKGYIDGNVGVDNSQIDGIPNGDGTFTWVKYATTILGGEMTDEPTAQTLYIGLAYNKPTPAESENPLDYIWGLINGENYWTDVNGVKHYTWIKYADTPISGMSDEPLGKQYIGFAFDKITSVESLIYTDYNWSKVTSNNGTDGIPIPGTTLFTWVKYGDNIYGAGISDSPNGKLYIGLAYNKDTYVESELADDYTWGLIDGANIDANGKYTWVKYADTPLTGMSDSPIGKSYIGFSFDNDSAVESEVYADYNWSLTNSNVDGDNEGGISVPTDGLYTWLKYADDEIGTNMSDSPTGKTYIGLAINKNTATESDDPTDYFWTLIGDVISYIGADGKTYYIWVKYASDALGTGLSDDPTGLTYIGIAYRKESPIESTNPLDYEWALILGEIKEQPKWLYTWVKFADDTLGNGMSDFPDGKLYMGLAYDKDTPIESIDPIDYVWNLITGEQGYTGADGKTYYTWVKYAKTPTDAILSDIPDGNDWMGMAFNKETSVESTSYLDYTWYPLSHTQTTDSGSFNQNNLIRVINIPTSYFSDKAVTEQTISDWVNANGISVSEIENIIFSIDDTTTEEPPYEAPSLDPNISLPLVLTGTTATTASFDWENTDTAIIRYELFYNTLFDNLGDLNVTSKTLTGLSNIAYSCYVIGYDTYGTAKQSNTVTFSLYVASTPNIYVGTNPGDVTDSSIRINWDINASFGATRYELYRNGVKVYDGALLTFNSTGLTPETSYAFYVIAYNGLIASLQSATLNVSTIATVTPTLTAPVIAFISNTDTSIKFSITIPSAEIGRVIAIRIEYKPTTSLTWNEAPAITYSNVANLNNLFDGTNYQIRVRSTDGTIISPYSNILTQTTLSSKKAKISLLLTSELSAQDIIDGYINSLSVWDGKPNSSVKVYVNALITYLGTKIGGAIIFKNSLTQVNSGYPQTLTFALDNTGSFSDLFKIESPKEGALVTVTVTITESINGIDAIYYTDTRNYTPPPLI